MGERALLKKVGWLCAGILLIPALWKLGSVFMQSPLFAVREIEVQGCSRLTPESVRVLSGVHEGDSLLELDTEAVSQRLEGEVPIRNASVVKKFPGKLLVRIMERRGAALVGIGDALFYVDSESVVLYRVRPGDPLDLPLITGLEDRPWKLGGPDLGLAAQAAMGLLGALNESGLPWPVSEIHVDASEGTSFFLEGFPVEVFAGWEGFATRIERLKSTLPELVSDPGGVASVDLRFDDRVIVTRRPDGNRKVTSRHRACRRPNA